MKRLTAIQVLGMVAILIGFIGLSVCVAGDAVSAEKDKVDACTLLSAAEISAVLGQPVGDGKPNSHANPVLGPPCEYKVGDYGTFSLWLGQNQTNTCDVTKAGLNKQNMKTTDAPGIGDCSFYAEMGYGMLQLNTWKGTDYLIITMMVPGATVDQQKVMAEKLMKAVLAKR